MFFWPSFSWELSFQKADCQTASSGHLSQGLHRDIGLQSLLQFLRRKVTGEHKQCTRILSASKNSKHHTAQRFPGKTGGLCTTTLASSQAPSNLWPQDLLLIHCGTSFLTLTWICCNNLKWFLRAIHEHQTSTISSISSHLQNPAPMNRTYKSHEKIIKIEWNVVKNRARFCSFSAVAFCYSDAELLHTYPLCDI